MTSKPSAWLIGCPAAGISADLERWREDVLRLDESVRPELVFVGDGERNVDPGEVDAAIEALEAHDGVRILWIGASGRPGEGSRSDELHLLLNVTGDLTLELGPLWRKLGRIAATNGPPILVILDANYAGEWSRSLAPQENIAAVFAPTKEPGRTKNRDTGGWLTFYFCDGLTEAPSPEKGLLANENQITLGGIRDHLTFVREWCGHHDDLPRWSVGPGLWSLPIGRPTTKASRYSPEFAYKRFVRSAHRRRLPFMNYDDLLDLSQFELTEEHGGARSPDLTISSLAQPPNTDIESVEIEPNADEEYLVWEVIGAPGMARPLARDLAYWLADPAHDDRPSPVYCSFKRFYQEHNSDWLDTRFEGFRAYDFANAKRDLTRNGVCLIIDCADQAGAETWDKWSVENFCEFLRYCVGDISKRNRFSAIFFTSGRILFRGDTNDLITWNTVYAPPLCERDEQLRFLGHFYSDTEIDRIREATGIAGPIDLERLAVSSHMALAPTEYRSYPTGISRYVLSRGIEQESGGGVKAPDSALLLLSAMALVFEADLDDSDYIDSGLYQHVEWELWDLWDSFESHLPEEHVEAVLAALEPWGDLDSFLGDVAQNSSLFGPIDGPGEFWRFRWLPPAIETLVGHDD